MKKLILLALTCVMLSGAQAQIVSSRSVTIKTEKKARTTTQYFRVGIGFMNVNGEFLDDTSSKTGYNVVYGFQKPITDFGLYWGMDFGLGSRGYKWSDNDGSEKYEESFIAHNIQISPINIGWKPTLTDHIKMDIHIGAYLSYDYTGKYKWTYGRESGSENLSDFIDALDYEDISYSRFDVGMNLGVGVWYDRFNLDLTYQGGFINALEDNDDGNAKTRNILLRLGISF